MLEQRLNGTKERRTMMEENMNKENSSEDAMTNDVLKRSYMEETQKKVLPKMMTILKEKHELVTIKSSIVNRDDTT